MRLATDVNRETYRDKAVAFSELNQSLTVIAIESRREKGVEIEPKVREWGAWMAYFRRLGKLGYVRLAETLGYLSVPARWPHEFDAAATVQSDHAAADAFVAELSRQRGRKFDLDRAAKNAPKLSRQIWAGKLKPTPPEDLREPTWREIADAKLAALGKENFPDVELRR